MVPTLEQLGIERLTVHERLELIGLIWDSVIDEDRALPVPDWHVRELERRLAAADADPDGGIPWEVVNRNLAGPKGV